VSKLGLQIGYLSGLTIESEPRKKGYLISKLCGVQHTHLSSTINRLVKEPLTNEVSRGGNRKSLLRGKRFGGGYFVMTKGAKKTRRQKGM